MQNILQRLHLTRCPRCVKTHSNHTYDPILVLWTLKVNVSNALAAHVKQVFNLSWQAHMVAQEPRRRRNEMENAFQSPCTASAKTRQRAFGRISSAHPSREASAFKRLVRKQLSDTSGPLLRFQSGRRTLMKQMAKVWVPPKRRRGLIAWLKGQRSRKSHVLKLLAIKCKKKMQAFGHWSASSVLAYEDYFLISTLRQWQTKSQN